MVLSLDGNGSAHLRNAVGQIKAAYLAHIVPDLKQLWTVSFELSLDELTQEDFDDLVHEWETGLRAASFFSNSSAICRHGSRSRPISQTDDRGHHPAAVSGSSSRTGAVGGCRRRSCGNHPAAQNQCWFLLHFFKNTMYLVISEFYWLD